MSHKFKKYLKYILWLTGCWQSLKRNALLFDRAAETDTIKLLMLYRITEYVMWGDETFLYTR